MPTSFGVDTLSAQPQACYRVMVDEVRFNNFSNIFGPNPTIPNPFGVNHHVRPMLTLVKTAGFISTDATLKPSSGQFFFE
jgi:hypothetical protein